MTSNAELIAEVIAYNADAEDSHYDGCYKRHAGCLAVMLRESAVPDAATERERAELFRSLDWMLWGVGMGDVFREPLADKMVAALSDAEFDQAQDLIRWWDERRGGPRERNLFVWIKAERDAALAALERVRAIHAPSLPGYGPKSCVHDGRAWPCQTVAALDVAPERLSNHCQECGAWGSVETHLRGCSLDGAPEPEGKP